MRPTLSAEDRIRQKAVSAFALFIRSKDHALNFPAHHRTVEFHCPLIVLQRGNQKFGQASVRDFGQAKAVAVKFEHEFTHVRFRMLSFIVHNVCKSFLLENFVSRLFW